jgi:hypothetical protein
MKKFLAILCLFLVTLSTFATPHYKYKAGSKKKAHRCHQDRYNNRPHAPGKAGNFRHDLSRYQR